MASGLFTSCRTAAFIVRSLVFLSEDTTPPLAAGKQYAQPLSNRRGCQPCRQRGGRPSHQALIALVTRQSLAEATHDVVPLLRLATLFEAFRRNDGDLGFLAADL